MDTGVVHQLCVILTKFSGYQILEWTNDAELLCPGGGDADAGSREAAVEEGWKEIKMLEAEKLLGEHG